MSGLNDSSSIQASPSYCPCCQRIFRKTPVNYMCPVDQTPLIDVSDPLPAVRNPSVYMGAVVVVLAAVVSLGATIV